MAKFQYDKDLCRINPCGLSSTVRSVICSLQSAVCSLQSAVCGLQPAVCKCQTPGRIRFAEAARDILNNFEILLAVLFPNNTTSRAITYTNCTPLGSIAITNQLVNWQSGIFSPLVISGCQHPAFYNYNY